jgi:hypothetical protein
MATRATGRRSLRIAVPFYRGLWTNAPSRGLFNRGPSLGRLKSLADQEPLVSSLIGDMSANEIQMNSLFALSFQAAQPGW